MDTLFQKENPTALPFDSSMNSIHVFVALCDNKYQGIVPVREKVGNGQDPDNNLYWGWGFGVRTYFKQSKDWIFIRSQKVSHTILERIIFKHKKKNYYLVADAYDGKYIRDCTSDFLKSLAGDLKDTVQIEKKVIGIKGNSKLVSYIGHNGLMDFSLDTAFENKDHLVRDCIILACISKKYFTPFLRQAKANPVLWTSNLMGPEAYTLHDALTGYINSESNLQIQNRAAKTYAYYTHCSENAARKLLITGW